MGEREDILRRALERIREGRWARDIARGEAAS
jgi:hypothetical protein